MKKYFKVNCRRLSSTPSNKEGVRFIEDIYNLRIGREGKSIAWEVVLEIFDDHKVTFISFSLSRHKNNSKIARFHRNKGDQCIDPFFTLSLFRHCFEICRSARDEPYAMGFYALDDHRTEKKEDINKRMSSYTSFIYRISARYLPGYQQAGNVYQNILIIFDPKAINLSDVENFIKIYQPIIEEDVAALYGEKISHKL